MARPEESKDPEGTEASAVDRFLEPFFTDAALRPVLLIVGLSLVTFGTGLVLLATRSRSPFAIASVVLLVIMSVEALQREIRRHRFGPLARILVGFWITTGLCAAGVVGMGWY